VRVGASRKGSSGGNGVSREIIGGISHPYYRSYSTNYDYLVMKLDSPVDTSEYPPIRLNSQESVPTRDEELTVIGFGTLSESGSYVPSRLQQVNINYIPTSTCNRRNSYNKSVRDSTMFCAGTGVGGKDSCQGDSGGPIFTNREPVEQVGIVSWGRGCAQRRYPGVYSRVSGEFDWIKSQICTYATTPPDYLCNNNSPGVAPGPVSPGTGTRPPRPSTRSPTPSPTRARPSTRPPTPSPTRAQGGQNNADPISQFFCQYFGICF